MPDSPQEAATGTREPPKARDALMMAARDLVVLESGLTDVRDALMRVPVADDTLDRGELQVEHLLASVAHALHKVSLARMEAEHGVRMTGGALP